MPVYTADSRSPMLYDSITGKPIGYTGNDGKQYDLTGVLLGTNTNVPLMSLDPTAGLQIGGAAPNAEQRAAVRAGIDPNFNGPVGLTALQALSLASTRRVDFVMLGDSNQHYGGYGFASGLEKALAGRFAQYASGIVTGFANGGGYSFTPQYPSHALDTPANSALGELLTPTENTNVYPGAINGASSSGASTGAVAVPAISPLDVNAALKFHFAYGGAAAWSGGAVQPGVRLGASPYTILASTSAISTTKAFDAMYLTSISITAGVRDAPLEGRFQIPAGNQAGPFVNYYVRVERADRTAGFSCHTLYSGAAMSAWDFAWSLQKAPDKTLTTFFSEVRRLQLEKGQSPIVAVYINTAFNDRSEENTPSRGPSRVFGTGDSVAEYVDNLRGIQRRIRKVWVLNEWPVEELYWLIVPSHRISDPDDADLVAYRAAAATELGSEVNTSVIDLGALMTAAQATSGGWYDGGGAVHLTATGYDAVGALIVDQIS